jgi:urease accessory protein
MLAENLPASAHHVMGGKTPASFADGILSGLGHPIIGADHLAFLVAVGIAVGAGGLSLALPAVFVAGSAIGVALHVIAVAMPAAELVVALSVVAVGALLASGSSIPVGGWAALFGAAGLFHGYAYGESIFGAEPAPLWAYLIGLVAVQTVLSVAVALVTRRTKMRTSDIRPRLAGATVAVVGLAVLAGQLIPIS